MLLQALLVLAAIVAAFAAYVAVQPRRYTVTREAVIAAPPATVFAHVVDFRKWDAWSPWARRDPAAAVSHSGPAAASGAVFSWAGNADVGVGKMTLLAVRPHEALDIALEFVKPFPGRSDVTFRFTPEGGDTRVVWSITGESGFLARAMCSLATFGRGLDAMIGPDYERGLAGLKAVVEGATKA